MVRPRAVCKGGRSPCPGFLRVSTTARGLGRSISSWRRLLPASADVKETERRTLSVEATHEEQKVHYVLPASKPEANARTDLRIGRDKDINHAETPPRPR